MRAGGKLFIVGAGASSEIGIPVGELLKDEIRQLTNISFDFGGVNRKTGSENLFQAMRKIANNRDPKEITANPLLPATRQITQGMPQATSIDDFIDSHRDNKDIEICGKLAIVESILSSEQKSILYHSSNSEQTEFKSPKIKETWLFKLFQALTKGQTYPELIADTEHYAFIVFNYDRSLEHYLFHQLQVSYGINAKESADFVNSLTILHPYGSVGALPWQGTANHIAFGANVPETSKFLGLIENIRTYTQQIEGQELPRKIETLIEKAELILFLGFAYHPNNLRILGNDISSSPKNILGTAFGISNSDCAEIQNELTRLFGSAMQNDVPVELDNKLKCFEFFEKYTRPLLRKNPLLEPTY